MEVSAPVALVEASAPASALPPVADTYGPELLAELRGLRQDLATHRALQTPAPTGWAHDWISTESKGFVEALEAGWQPYAKYPASSSIGVRLPLSAEQVAERVAKRARWAAEQRAREADGTAHTKKHRWFWRSRS